MRAMNRSKPSDFYHQARDPKTARLKVNPKLQKLKPEDIIDDSLIPKIYASGY